MKGSTRQSNIRSTSRHVLAAITISLGDAAACSRAARVGVSPIATSCRVAPAPSGSPTTTSPVAMPTLCLRGQVGRGLQHADCVENCKASAYRLLSVMFMRHWVPEIDPHAIVQILSDKSIKPRHDIGDSFMEGSDQIVHVLGVKARRKGHRATTLQTMIVSCRRSGLPGRTGTADNTLCSAGFPAFTSSLRSLLILAGGTTIDGRSGCGNTELATSSAVDDLLGGCVLRSSATSDLVAASGSVFSSRLSSATRSW